MTASANIGLKGFYTLTLRNEKTGKVRAEYEFENLILDSGLDMGGIGAVVEGVVLGSDTSEPVATQSTMSNVIGSANSVQAQGDGGVNLVTAPYYLSYFTTYRVAVGVATGNINQVAVGWGVHASNGTYAGLFSLARVKDSGGNPITITKLSDEVLDVKYTLRVYAPSDATGTVTIGGQTYNYIVRPAQFNGWAIHTVFDSSWFSTIPDPYSTASDINTVFNTPLGGVSAGTKSLGSYANGTYTRVINLSFDLNDGNVGGTRSIYFSTGFSNWQCQFNNAVDGTPVPKDATKTWTQPFQITWGRAS